MRKLHTDLGLSIGFLKGILEEEVNDLIGGLNFRKLVSLKVYGGSDDPKEAETLDMAQVRGERPSERSMRLSEAKFKEAVEEQKVKEAVPAAGYHPPAHSIAKGT